MNATDILGELLRPRKGGGGGGVFKDIFGGGARAQPQRKTGTTTAAPEVIEREARELEDMLGVGKGGSGGAGPASRPQTRWDPPATTGIPPALPQRGSAVQIDPIRQEAEATVLIRAMINAAKADGRLSADEQRAVFDKLGGTSQEAMNFLRREAGTPADAREFAWSVPIGLEHKVYTVSLAAIDLDTKAESDYLRELAHGLRLPKEVCDHIHQRYGVPLLPA